MTGLRYVGVSRAQGPQQEVPPSPADSGHVSVDPREHTSRTTNWKAASSQRLPRADFSEKGRRPWGPWHRCASTCRSLWAGVE